MKIKDCTNEYQCSVCKEVFQGKEILLKPYSDKWVCGSSVLIINEDGEYLWTHNPLPTKDKTLHCPKCGQLHLFGLNNVNKY